MEEERNADVALSTVQVADMEEGEQRSPLCALDLCGAPHLSSQRTCITTTLLSRQNRGMFFGLRSKKPPMGLH